MITIYIIGAALTLLMYISSHGWSMRLIDWMDITIILLWPLSLMFFLYQLFYEKR